jgi:serine/threonine protein kinase
MAPEMAAETGHTFPVDWWALGVVVFEMISGAPFPWTKRENEKSVRAAASYLLEHAVEAPGMEGCWDCRETPSLTLGRICPDELDSMRHAALDLVRSLLIPDPIRRCDTIIQEPDQTRSVARFFTRLENHDFFQGVSWPCVHCGSSPSAWPNFDHRLGFLQLLQGGEDVDEISTEQQELFHAF